MPANYLQAALDKAHYEILSDDQSFYGEISGFDGVYAHAQHWKAAAGNWRKF
jgi:hypothetical protein